MGCLRLDLLMLDAGLGRLQGAGAINDKNKHFFLKLKEELIGEVGPLARVGGGGNPRSPCCDSSTRDSCPF